MVVAPRRPSPVAFARVPVLCPGGTAVCLATGPSLVQDDVDACRGKSTVIAVNDAWRLAPWADALHASDAAWWRMYQGVPAFAGLKFCLEPAAATWPGVQVLRNTGTDGLETTDPTGVRTGRNSGAAALNLAVQFGATRILLLGYDMDAPDESHSHFFGAHPLGLRGGSPYALFREMFATMVAPLQALGVEVINCSRQTALTCFPRMPLAEALR
jgi:hypothetical protein